MSWLWFALLAAFVWAVVSIIDKVAVERYVPSAFVYLLFTGLSTLAVVLGFIVVGRAHIIPTPMLALSLLTGVLFIGATYTYFSALEISDAPVVTALLHLVPILSTLFGFVFFGERFLIHTYVGIVMVVAGAIAISVKEDAEATDASRVAVTALWLMALYAVLASSDYALEKYILSSVKTSDYFFWARVGDVCSAAFLMVSHRKGRLAFLGTLRSIPRVILSISFTNEVLNLIATYAVALAYAAGPLALVSAGLSVQPAFVLVMVPVANRCRPGLVPQRGTGRRVFLTRAAAITMIVVGVYMIGVGRR